MPSFLTSLVQSLSKPKEKETTNFTRASDVDGWVFLAEEPTPTTKLTYADIAAGRKSSADSQDEIHCQG